MNPFDALFIAICIITFFVSLWYFAMEDERSSLVAIFLAAICTGVVALLMAIGIAALMIGIVIAALLINSYGN
jgi:hypothetical protein